MYGSSPCTSYAQCGTGIRTWFRPAAAKVSMAKKASLRSALTGNLGKVVLSVPRVPVLLQRGSGNVAVLQLAEGPLVHDGRVVGGVVERGLLISK